MEIESTRDDARLVELASPSEVGLLALAVGAVVAVLFSRRRRRQAKERDV